MKNPKMKTYTATVKIGNGTRNGGFYQTTLLVQATNEISARRKALKLAFSSTDVTVDLSRGKAKGINPVYQATFGDNPEVW